MARKRMASQTVKWGRFVFTEAEIERQIAEATKRGAEELRTEPLATSIRFDKRTRRVILELNKGSTLSIPVALLQGLQDASLKDLANVEILSPGSEIEWPTLDQQFSVTGLLSGVFGNKAWMAELGRRAAVTRPKAKAKAARANGKKGSRPRKTTTVSIV